jgi:hypothetical protein
VQALDQARRLIGAWWAHSKPDNPKGYLEAISGTLEGYPSLLAAECCDPQVGLARGREQPPTVASIVGWCEQRLAIYRAVVTLARKRPEQRAPPERAFDLEDRPAADGRELVMYSEELIAKHGRPIGRFERPPPPRGVVHE